MKIEDINYNLPIISVQKQKRGINPLFYFWWTRGEVYVWQNRAEILSLHRHGHKVSFWSVAIESRGDSFQNDNGAILRSPFKNSPPDCFFTAFDSPHIIPVQKQKRHTCVYLFYFWWTRGESNPCPKTS